MFSLRLCRLLPTVCYRHVTLNSTELLLSIEIVHTHSCILQKKTSKKGLLVQESLDPSQSFFKGEEEPITGYYAVKPDEEEEEEEDKERSHHEPGCCH